MTKESGLRTALADLANAARVYANVVEERYHGRTGWASVAEARSLLLAATMAAEGVLAPPETGDPVREDPKGDGHG